MKRVAVGRWLVIVLLGLGSVSCATRVEPYLSVGEVQQRVGGTAPAPLPPDGLLVRAIATDTDQVSGLLVELSDSTQGQRIWVRGFTDPPARGSELWTRVTGLPEQHERKGAVYPTRGRAQPAIETRYLPARPALGILFGAIAVVAFAVIGIVGLATRPPRARRCPVCGEPAATEWITCSMCGHAFVAPAAPPQPPLLVPARPPEPSPPQPHQEPVAPESATATRIIRPDEP